MRTLDELALWCAAWAEFVQQNAAVLATYDAHPMAAHVWPHDRRVIRDSRDRLVQLRADTEQTLRFSMALPDERARLELMVRCTIQAVGDFLNCWEHWLNSNYPPPPIHPPGWAPPPPPPEPVVYPAAELLGIAGCIVGAVMILGGLAAGLESSDPQNTNPGALPFFLGMAICVIAGFYWLEGRTRRVHGDQAANTLTLAVGAASVGYAAYRHHQHHEAKQRRATAEEIAAAIRRQSQAPPFEAYPTNAFYQQGS